MSLRQGIEDRNKYLLEPSGEGISQECRGQQGTARLSCRDASTNSWFKPVILH
jgi:hypothetical protein